MPLLLRKTPIALLLAAAALTTPKLQAQSSPASLGTRQIKSVWIEGSSVIVITPETPFETANGCAIKTSAVILISNPSHKLLYAAALSAMSTGKPIAAWAMGCHSEWSTTQPIIYAMGTGNF